MALKLKLDENGHVVVVNGKPVYVYDDGKEIEADVDGMMTKITELNSEAKNHRLKAKEFEDALKQFGDLKPEDVVAMRTIIEDAGGSEGIKKLQQKAGVNIDEIKKSITDAYEAKLQEKDKVLEGKDGEIRKLLVSNGFSNSKYVADKLTLPADIVEATFGHHFKVEEGQVVAYLGQNKILSREKPGEVAGIDEALHAIVEAYPMKDRILKAPGGGSGSGGPGGGGGGGGNSLTRSQFAALSPTEQMKHSTSGGTVTDG